MAMTMISENANLGYQRVVWVYIYMLLKSKVSTVSSLSACVCVRVCARARPQVYKSVVIPSESISGWKITKSRRVQA